MVKKILLLIVILLLIFLTRTYCQYNIKHKNLSIMFNNKTHNPEVVYYVLDKKHNNCTSSNSRNSFSFKEDKLNDSYLYYSEAYRYSGYDKGHLKSYEDSHCDLVESSECFYYSNIAPQNHHLNIGVWKSLENKCRKLSKTSNVEIYAGCFDSIGVLKKIRIPKYFYKCIIINKDTSIYIFENIKPKIKELNFYKKDKKTLYQMFNKIKYILN